MGTFRVSILGVGLLGGSVGLAASQRITDCQITGYGHRPDTLRRAIERGAIHASSPSAAAAVAEADLVILATPVGLFEGLLREIAPALRRGAIVTDVGSTKRAVVHAAEAILPKGVRFVGCHPMAGSEKRGVDFATADLFDGALCILTPTAASDESAVEIVRQFWHSLGARLIDLSPEEHDRALAQVSHLPHAVAAALVAMQQEPAIELAGKGFADATRIAAGDGELWRDILLENRDNVLESIDRLMAELGGLSTMLKTKNGDHLKAWLDQAASRRAGMTGRMSKS